MEKTNPQKINLEYKKIVKRSIDIVRKNKWLLIYGALLAGSFSSSGSGSDWSEFGNQEENNLENLPAQTSMVLSEYTSIFMDWLSSVTPLTWVVLVTGIILAVIIGITVSIVLSNWAKASLITGVQLALNDQEVDLTNTSPAGKAKFKSLILYSVIVCGIVLGILLALSLVGGVFYFLFKEQLTILTIISILLGAPVVVALIIGSLLLMITNVFADRLIVLKNYSPTHALKSGFALSRKSFLPSALMGIINSLLSGIFSFLATALTLIILGIPTFAMVYPSVLAKTWPSPIVFVFLAIFILLFVVVSSVISGATQVFKFANWNQVFTAVITSEEKI